MILYVGTYTEMLLEDYGGHAEGIYRYSFSPQNGSLKFRRATQTRNPSYLCLHPNRKWLFSVEEAFSTKHPAISAFQIGDDGDLEFINRQPMPGGLPCHLAVVHESLISVACYENGRVVTFPIHENGRIGSVSDLIQHHGQSMHPDRQEGPHAHMIAPLNSADNVAVCDLGMDKICLYQVDHQLKKLFPATPSTIEIPPGNGPRHMVLHPNNQCAFLMCELTSNLIVLENQSGEWKLHSTNSTLPGDFSGEPSGAAIRVHPSGLFVYASNRVHNSISIFQFNENDRSLKSLGYQPSSGKTPRDFTIDPSGRWLLAAHQDSDSIVVFKIDQENGTLQQKAEYEVKSPVCLVWGE